MSLMKTCLALIVALPFASTAWAGTGASADSKSIKFNYRNADITKVIDDYAKASGQRFVVDPSVRGKVTIINSSPVSLEDAFNQMSTGLATNGVGISVQGDMMVVKQARAIQRDLIPVVSELPSMHPQRMVTWVISLKHTSAAEINRQLRILTSKDGELVPYTPTNQLLITDWTPNLHRIAAIVKELDTAEAVAAGKKFKPISLKDEEVGPPTFRAKSKN